MNQLEMLGKLMEDPKRKAKMIVSNVGEKVFDADNLIVDEHKKIKWECGSSYNFYVDSKSQWEIIEPPRKLKEMCFGEAYYLWANTNIDLDGFRSVVTEQDFNRLDKEITKEELVGKWTIEGIYE